MTVRVGINGFGRIGRNVLRAIKEYNRTDVTVVAINDVGDLKTNVHLLKYDSVHGPFHGEVSVEGDGFDIGTGHIKVLSERDPSKLPWASLGVDIVMECTGIFSDKEKASAHLTAGAKKVLVSAPSKGADCTVVYGVNHDKLSPDHKVVSNASCTTNCLAPVAKVLNDLCGISRLYDDDHLHQRPAHPRPAAQDPHRARGGSVDDRPRPVPRRRLAWRPSWVCQLDGTAIRVPTPNLGIDLCFIPGREQRGRHQRRH
jgi:glyceraldehyde 3-phosphate dehydrogenase